MNRRELYDLVWSEPLRHLAPRLGLSDVGLAKLCDRLEIPRPAMGYWVAQLHGRGSNRPELPRAQNADDENFTIEVKEEEVCPVAVEPAPQIKIPRQLRDPHKLVRDAPDKLKRYGVDRYGLLDPNRADVLAVRVSPDQLSRALRLMNAAIKALEARGHEVQVVEQQRSVRTFAIIEREQIAFRLREQVRQVDHKPTSEELERLRRWPSSSITPYDYEPIGSLYFEVDQWSVPKGLRSRWSDTRKRSLDDQIGEFVVGIEAIGRYERLRSDEREEERRIEAEARAKWEQKQRRRELEAKRLEGLIEIVDRWRVALEARSFLTELEKSGCATEQLATVLEVARDAVGRLDPLAQPSATVAELVQLFNETGAEL
jgi:hypothetical protein